MVIFVFKQKTAYEMRISDWSSDVCSSDLLHRQVPAPECRAQVAGRGTRPAALMDGEVVAPDTFLVRAVEVVVVAMPGLPAGGEEHVIQRVFAAAALYLQRSAAPMQAVVRPVGVALRAPEVG